MIKLITDSREQLPLDFRSEVFDGFIMKALPVGDYGCEINDAIVPIMFERKSLSDLFGTMTNGYDRFKSEMQRAKEQSIKLVLMIEGSMREVAGGYKHSEFSGDSMLRKLAMLYVKYDLEYHFCNDRREMARHIEETFCAVQRLWKKEKRS